MDRQEMINGDMTTNAFLNSIDDQIIEVLEDVLKKHDIPSSWYSFEMEKEYVVAMLFNDERWQVIYNEKGIIVIPAKFTDAHDFSDGLAAVKDDSRNWGYIDKSGKMVIEPKFSREPGDYHAGITWAEKNDGSSEGWGERVFLNKRGEIISSGWEGDILWVGNFILAHKKNGKRGEGYILDADCHELNRIEDIELFPPVTSAFRPVVLPVSGHLLTENTLRSKDDLSVLCVSTSAFPVEGRDKYRFDLYDAGEGYFWIVGDYRKVYGLSNARGEVLVLFKKSDF